MQAREAFGGGRERLFFLTEGEAHLMRPIGGVIVKARSRDNSDADPLDDVARKGNIVGEAKAGDVRHDVVGAAWAETLEAGILENAQHTIALDAIRFGEALVIRVRQLQGEGPGSL